MEAGRLRGSFQRAHASFSLCVRSRVYRPHLHTQRRPLATVRESPTDTSPTTATPSEILPSFQAAKPFSFDDSPRDSTSQNLNALRVVPASPSYFSTRPAYTDDLLHVQTLLRRTQLLPTLPADQVPKTVWKTLAQYQADSIEGVNQARYRKILNVLQRLNAIHRSLMPMDVHATLTHYMRSVQPSEDPAKPLTIDQMGRARAVGRRKASTAVAFVVQGDGQVMVNGRNLGEAFSRVHDRESAIWPLKISNRVDRYNVWAFARGGGCTGQAEALMLAVAKALLVHEPALKPALRRGMSCYICLDMLFVLISLQLVVSHVTRAESSARSPAG